MNARLQHRFGEEQRQHLGKRDAGIADPDEQLAGRGEWSVDQNGRSGALISTSEVVLVLGESQVTRLGPICGGKTREHQRMIANNFTPKLFSDFSSSKRHQEN